MNLKEVNVPDYIFNFHEDGTKDVYIKHEKLGYGGFAIVYRVTHQATNIDYAMKAIPKSRYKSKKGRNALEKLKNEVLIQKSLHHPNIVKSYGAFSDANNYYIIIEYCPGNNVKNLLRSKAEGHFTENETKTILRDVLRGVIYLHRHKIIHRDLKLENFLYGADGKVKIADFGISRHLSCLDEKRFTICGSPLYFSPELLQAQNEGHSFEVDIWALGVCTFLMLTGTPPFKLKKGITTYDSIRRCQYSFPSYLHLSKEAKDFIHTIFKINPEERPKASDLLAHAFIAYDSVSTKGIGNDLVAPSDTIDLPESPPPTPRLRNKKLKCISKFPQQYNVKMNVNEYVTKYCVHHSHLGYLLLDGSVGVCFTDKSSMIMDPCSTFIQFYKNAFSVSELIILRDSKAIIPKNGNIDTSELKTIKNKISLLRRIERAVKNQNTAKKRVHHYDSDKQLIRVKSWLETSKGVIFEMNNGDIQVHFNDHLKLMVIGFSKMSLFRSMKDMNNLISLTEVEKMDRNAIQYQKLHAARKMMTELHSTKAIL